MYNKLKTYLNANRSSALCSWVVFACVTGLLVWWQQTGAPYLDDLVFRVQPAASHSDYYPNGAQDVTTFSEALRSCAIHYYYTNSRLTNMLMIMSNLIPEWLTRSLHGVLIGAMFLLTVMLIGGRSIMRSYGFTAGVWLAMWCLMPFWNCMISSDFMFNYAWPAIPFLLYIYLFRSYSDSHPDRCPLWLALVVAFIAGIMHEGEGIPLASGSCMALLVNWRHREYRTKRRLWMTITLIAGLILIVFTPATIFRVKGSFYSAGSEYTPLSFLRNMTFDLIVYVIPIIAVIVALISKRVKCLSWLRRNTFLLTAIAASGTIVVCTHIDGRGVWYIYLLEFILVGRLLLELFPTLRNPHVATGVICSLLLCFILGDTARRQARYSKPFWEVVNSASPSADNVIFKDIPATYNEPWWTFNVVHSIEEVEQLWMLGSYVLKHEVIAPILPESFKGKPVDEWPRVPGNTDLRGQFPMLVSTTEPCDSLGRLVISFAEPTCYTNPIYRLLRRDKRSIYPFYPKRVIYQGDTLWLYFITPVRRLDSGREITSYDFVHVY